MATHVEKDTLALMVGAVCEALLALAFAFEDNDRVDVKFKVMKLRSELINATSGRTL